MKITIELDSHEAADMEVLSRIAGINKPVQLPEGYSASRPSDNLQPEMTLWTSSGNEDLARTQIEPIDPNTKVFVESTDDAPAAPPAESEVDAKKEAEDAKVAKALKAKAAREKKKKEKQEADRIRDEKEAAAKAEEQKAAVDTPKETSEETPKEPAAKEEPPAPTPKPETTETSRKIRDLVIKAAEKAGGTKEALAIAMEAAGDIENPRDLPTSANSDAVIKALEDFIAVAAE